jgi:UDP-glucose:(heptosyl)LPS alpha-1,3-glucosyltransferase
VAVFNGVRRVLLSAERRILTAPDGPLLVALSDLVATGAKEHYGLAKERVRVVRNGVQLERLRLSLSAIEAKRALGTRDDEVLFLAIAENHRLKGIAELVRAFEALPKDRLAKLRILGGPICTSADPRIQFLGHREDVPVHLLAADVLVHPTYYDPSSRVVLEAIAMHKPVITTEWNGAADFLRHGGGVVLRDPSDTVALGEALERLLEASERKRMSASLLPLRRAVSMERHVEEMLDVYSECRS